MKFNGERSMRILFALRLTMIGMCIVTLAMLLPNEATGASIRLTLTDTEQQALDSYFANAERLMDGSGTVTFRFLDEQTGMKNRVLPGRGPMKKEGLLGAENYSTKQFDLRTTGVTTIRFSGPAYLSVALEYPAVGGDSRVLQKIILFDGARFLGFKFMKGATNSAPTIQVSRPMSLVAGFWTESDWRRTWKGPLDDARQAEWRSFSARSGTENSVAVASPVTGASEQLVSVVRFDPEALHVESIERHANLESAKAADARPFEAIEFGEYSPEWQLPRRVVEKRWRKGEADPSTRKEYRIESFVWTPQLTEKQLLEQWYRACFEKDPVDEIKWVTIWDMDANTRERVPLTDVKKRLGIAEGAD
jgi:hypothetical protein